jgi:hypothetical protein
MLKRHYSDSYYILARFFGGFARSISTTSFVFGVSPNVIIDPQIDHLSDHPMERNPNTLVHKLSALPHEVECPSDMYYESYGTRPILKLQELVRIYMILKV